MRYEKYKINKLFTSQNGDTDIKKSDITGTGVPVITSGVDKYGIMGETDIEARIIKENTITIDMFGNAFFRPFKYKMVTHARVFSMELIGREMTESIGLFLVSHFHWLPQVYNYSNMCSFNKIKDSTITLPTLDELDENSPYSDEGFIPDWDYMEKCVGEFEELRVAELEEIRVSELEAYLVETGLSDYQLTDEDIEILSSLGIKDGDALKLCEEFKIVDIAKVEYGNKFDKNKMSRQNPSINFVSRTASNNGVSDFVDNNGTVPYKEGLITLALGGSIGSCFLQEQPFYTGQNVGVIDLGDIDYHAKIYFTEALGYKCKQSFSAFGNEINKHLKTDLSVSLPIKQDEKGNPVIDPEHKYHPEGHIPDWEFMERYIRAIEKVVIADVVKYKDEVIEKTKEVVG